MSLKADKRRIETKYIIHDCYSQHEKKKKQKPEHPAMYISRADKDPCAELEKQKQDIGNKIVLKHQEIVKAGIDVDIEAIGEDGPGYGWRIPSLGEMWRAWKGRRE